jgi:hypothetical protein
MKTGPSAFSILMTYVGMLMFLAPLLLSIAFPRVPIGWALAVGIALGAPVMLWSMHLQSKDTPGSQKSFLPHRSEWGPFAWNATAGICLLVLLLLPGLLLTPWLVLPAGDAVSHAWTRAGLLTLVWCIVPWWSRRSITWVRLHFAGRITPTFEKSLFIPKPSSRPGGLAMLQRYSLELIVITIGIVLNSGLFAIPAGLAVPQGVRGRGRGILTLLVWVRDNPNFLAAFTMLVLGKLLVQTLLELAWSRNGERIQETREGETE